MQLRFDNERLLAVVAHPDDAELLCAGTLARAKADGAAIGICFLCQGDRGQPDPPIENLGDVRAGEMQAAANLLGADLYAGGFGDARLFDSPESRDTLTEIIRRFRPTLILGHSPNDYHADHRAAAVVTDAASWFSASPGYKTSSPPLAAPPALWQMDTIQMHGFEPHFFVDVSEFTELKRRMMLCHASQLARGDDRSFAPLEDIMLRQSSARGAQAGVAAAEAFRHAAVWKRVQAW